VAVGELHGPAAGLAVLEGFEPPTWLAGSYLWAAVLADLHRRSGNSTAAARFRDLAIESAPTEALSQLLQRRLKLSSKDQAKP
jgi:predicted RNA polymerase sigma factor